MKTITCDLCGAVDSRAENAINASIPYREEEGRRELKVFSIDVCPSCLDRIKERIEEIIVASLRMDR